MTIKKFAELVCETVGRNNQEFMVDERVVIGIAELLTATYIREYLAANRTIPSGYFQSYEMNVVTPAGGGRKYVEFVPPAMNIGDNAGFAYIGAIDDETSVNSNYVLLKQGQLSAAAGLEAQSLGGRPAVKPEGQRGYLYNEPPILDKLKVTMVPQLTELDEDDEMFGSDDIGAFIFDKSIEYIGIKRNIKEDKQTDGQSN